MKGIFFTIITFIVILGVIAFISTGIKSNIEISELSNSRISSQRVFNYWSSVFSGFENLLNISTSKLNDTIQINDTLPAVNDISDLLTEYGKFVDQYYKDPTIGIRFQDSSGNPIPLSSIESKLSIIPMYLNYTWPNFGKNSMQTLISEGNFPFIKNVSIELSVSPMIKNVNDIEWAPYKKCTGATKNCLKLNLTVKDNSTQWVSNKTEFDADRESSVKIDLIQESEDYWVRVNIGRLPDLINIDTHHSNVTASTSFKFNITEFFINYPSKLNVSTPFAQKVY